MASSGHKRFTVIIVPRSDQRTLNFSVPTLAVPIVVGLLLVCVAAATVLTLSVKQARANVDQRSSALKVMRRVNAEQKIQIEVMAIKSQAMAADIDRIRSLDQQVRELLGTPLQEAAPVAAVRSTTEPIIQPAGGEKADENVAPQVDALINRRAAPQVDRASIDRSRATLMEALTTSDRLDQLKSELSRRLPELVAAKGKIEDRLDYLAHRPTGWPAWGDITSWFGWRPSPFGWGGDDHPGIDIAVDIGTPVEATADGTVIWVGRDGSYGRLVILDHGYGFRTYYAHLSSYEVEVGDKVKRGTIVAYSGNTGLSTGPHLHYEVRLWGKATDPEPYMEQPSLKEG